MKINYFQRAENETFSCMTKKAQVTLFVIIAIAIVLAVVISLFFLGKIKIPLQKNEAELYFLNCMDAKVLEAAKIAEIQGGYLTLPTFEQGSSTFPFSSYFNLLALDIPYWFYISGNGLQRTQKPSIEQIQEQLGIYTKNKISDCLDFDKFPNLEVSYEQVTSVDVKIKSRYIETTILMPLKVKSIDKESIISEHSIRTTSYLGDLYTTASEIFDSQQQGTILENYSLDVINAYAPTTSLEISCAPKIWPKAQVQENLKSALQENIQELKIKGSSYTLKSAENKYFVINLGKDISKRVNFLYLKTWPSRLEVWPSENEVLRADPIGSEAGLGSLGFCLIPYHFVYDIYFPVLVQISSGTEVFQFPVTVAIDKMAPRQAILNESVQETFDICKTTKQLGTVFTSYESKPVESEILVRCLGQTCPIGTTKLENNRAKLTAEFPKCVNAVVIARTPGYQDSEAIVSTNEPFISSISLIPIYELSLDINLENNENAIVSFSSEDYSTNVFYPQQSKINLSQGTYTVNVQLYKQSSLSIGAQQIEKCLKVPVSGIPGMVGITTEQCYNISVPASQLTNVLFGGGSSEFSASDSELKNARKLSIVAERLDTPLNIDDLSIISDSLYLNPLQITLS
jgi:hypothetical protein